MFAVLGQARRLLRHAVEHVCHAVVHNLRGGGNRGGELLGLEGAQGSARSPQISFKRAPGGQQGEGPSGTGRAAAALQPDAPYPHACPTRCDLLHSMLPYFRAGMVGAGSAWLGGCRRSSAHASVVRLQLSLSWPWRRCPSPGAPASAPAGGNRGLHGGSRTVVNGVDGRKERAIVQRRARLHCVVTERLGTLGTAVRHGQVSACSPGLRFWALTLYARLLAPPVASNPLPSLPLPGTGSADSSPPWRHGRGPAS